MEEEDDDSRRRRIEPRLAYGDGPAVGVHHRMRRPSAITCIFKTRRDNRGGRRDRPAPAVPDSGERSEGLHAGQRSMTRRAGRRARAPPRARHRAGLGRDGRRHGVPWRRRAGRADGKRRRDDGDARQAAAPRGQQAGRLGTRVFAPDGRPAPSSRPDVSRPPTLQRAPCLRCDARGDGGGLRGRARGVSVRPRDRGDELMSVCERDDRQISRRLPPLRKPARRAPRLHNGARLPPQAHKLRLLVLVWKRPWPNLDDVSMNLRVISSCAVRDVCTKSALRSVTTRFVVHDPHALEVR